jgi:type I restriction-modification system DNA methylase subunit
LARGLADTSKIEKEFKIILRDSKGNESIKKEKKQVHRVQLLDPATGTGTFLNEVIRYIHRTYFSGQAGMWSGYV